MDIQIIKAFFPEIESEKDFKLAKIVSGHINLTFRLEIKNKNESYILQKINTNIFKNADNLMENILNVTNFISEKGMTTLKFITTPSGKSFVRTNEGECWRCMLYLPNSVNLDTLTINADTYIKAGKALADFERSLMDFDASKLYEIIPNFHNTESRYNDFEAALKADASGRAKYATDEIMFVKNHKFLSTLITSGLNDGSISLRVTHNDTKLSNIMVDKDTQDVICLIDFDTIMPGSVLYDFGDALRMAGSSAKEDEPNVDIVHFVPENFENFCKGYVSAAKDFLSKKELELLPESVAVLTYECGTRFLTDYINGDTYFRCSYPEHNLVRCRTQFKLVSDILDNIDSLHEIVERLI